MSTPQSPTSDSASKSGIVTSANGQRSIPSSTRADGSKRKEIKIRPGYRPPEDVEVYRNRTAEAFRTRGKGGVPGADTVTKEDEKSAASNKNAKRREARKRAKAAAGEDGVEGDDEGVDANGQEPRQGTVNGKYHDSAGVDAPAQVEEEDPVAEKEKKAKKLRKKLREARELQQKKDRGEGLLPEQLQKAIRINELIRELDRLGFGPDEEVKAE